MGHIKTRQEIQVSQHILRETLTIRIPVEASDGYFHLVLCPLDRKKVSCPSTVLRILSASTTPSSLRGVSLSTLPLELGALAMTVHANDTVGRIMDPAKVTVTRVARPCISSTAKREAAVAIYGKSGTEEMVGSTVEKGNLQYKVLGVRSVSHDQAGGGSGNGSESSELQLSPTAPVPPYRIYFIAKSDIESRNEGDYFALPTMKLSGMAEQTTHQLLGHYFAWTRRRPGKSADQKIPITEPWVQTVISSLPTESRKARISQARKRVFKIHFICDGFESEALRGRNLEIRIMRSIRPSPLLHSPKLDVEEELLATLNGIVYAQMMLDQPGFAAESMGMRTGMGEKQTRTVWRERRRVDRVPLHRMGLRMEGDRMRDRGVGVSGFFVVR